MALPAAFLEELRARTPLAAVVGRSVRLARSGRHWKACCPFHDEKSPSFYVYEDHFHCFGCGAHGDAVSFLMQKEGLGFPEAVARLAAEAGLQLPAPEPAQQAATRRRLDLTGLLDLAGALFRRRLEAPEGAAARDYLHARGVSAESIARFGLGWSGDGRGERGGLGPAALGTGEASTELLVEAGLLREAEDGPARAFFFNRLMFPIRDARGRTVGFGGRVLGDGQPKYLNGPETPVFAKRRALYGLDLAREGVRRGAVPVVVEGYLDVVMLHQAGFAGAVAPLGTALGEAQLELLWRLGPEPVLCFDGDAAGRRAARRTADLALPGLTPERRLRLGPLPDGQDPDSLVRARGAAAFQAVLEAARPLSEVLFEMLREGVAPTPEGRAAFRAALVASAGRIGDRGLAAEYRRSWLDRFFAERPSRAAPARAEGRARPGPPPVAAAHLVAYRAHPPFVGRHEAARALLAILLHHPDLLHDVEEALAGLELPPALSRLRHGLLGACERTEQLDSAALITHLDELGLGAETASVLSNSPAALPRAADTSVMPAEAEEAWWHFYGLFNRSRLDQEFAAAIAALSAGGGEADNRRAVAIGRARLALRAGELEIED